jgi:glycogen debranching enzyme
VTGSSESLHTLVTVLSAPSFVLSDPDGQVRAGGVQGWFTRDRRALAQFELDIDDVTVVPVGRDHTEPAVAAFHSVIRDSTAHWRDSSLRVRRERQLSPAILLEHLDITNNGASSRELTVTLRAATDFAGVDAVRADRAVALVAPAVTGDRLQWPDRRGPVTLQANPAGVAEVNENGVARVTWAVVLEAGQTWRLTLTVKSSASVKFSEATFEPLAAENPPKWTLTLPAGPASANLADLRALLLADPLAPDDSYLAAGSPWYLTLFGRDTIWAARLLLPLGTDLAAGTLRTLARRQGTRDDPATEQQPGKIPHEARAEPIDTGQVQLSSLYYGTIDATPLWVCLLHEAWRAGMPEEDVGALMPNLVAAMNWITGPAADPDGDGLIEYVSSGTGGLTHQGWKDSHDAFLHKNGRHPAAPLALCEVQGYSYAAATAAAELATAFGQGDGPQWIEWAGLLKQRFHESFWIEDNFGSYPAIALDADKTPVEGATSNIGHLLGTGLLDAGQAELIATRLSKPDVATPFGLRTLSSASRNYNPFSYHRGSIWPHDTAIAMVGLVVEGHTGLATRFAEGILAAARHFGNHTPELYAVLDDSTAPLAYPSACVPQAWSAAAAVRAALHLG